MAGLPHWSSVFSLAPPPNHDENQPVFSGFSGSSLATTMSTMFWMRIRLNRSNRVSISSHKAMFSGAGFRATRFAFSATSYLRHM